MYIPKIFHVFRLEHTDGALVYFHVASSGVTLMNGARTRVTLGAVDAVLEFPIARSLGPLE